MGRTNQGRNSPPKQHADEGEGTLNREPTSEAHLDALAIVAGRALRDVATQPRRCGRRKMAGRFPVGLRWLCTGCGACPWQDGRALA